MRLHSVWHDFPSNHLPSDINLDVTNVYPNLLDSDSATCDDILVSKWTTIMWSLPLNQTTNRYRVYMKGTQQCHGMNSVWFLSGIELGPIVIECDVTQQQEGDMAIYDISCLCACGLRCEYLRLQLQILPWIDRTLSLCYYEHLEWFVSLIAVPGRVQAFETRSQHTAVLCDRHGESFLRISFDIKNPVFYLLEKKLMTNS